VRVAVSVEALVDDDLGGVEAGHEETVSEARVCAGAAVQRGRAAQRHQHGEGERERPHHAPRQMV